MVVTMEENVKNGGFGEKVLEYYNETDADVRVLQITLPDDYIEHGNVDLLEKEGLHRCRIRIQADYCRLSGVRLCLKNRSANLKESFCGIVCRRDFEHAPAEATRENNKEQEFDMKERLDVLLVSQGLATSREKAKAVIMAGNVLVNGQREDKAGTMIDVKAQITVKGTQLKYVSRGGLKLEKAMSHFDLTLDGKVCMDVGASTGGFTDCMLQNGAVKVYSVDVGHGQLDWKLRNDERVTCMEKTNIRYVVPEDIAEPPAFVSIDVSFISLTKVLLPVRNLMTADGEVVCLIKPQFEAGREKVGKKGVVRDPKVHEEVIHKVIDYAAEIGLESRKLEFSPIKGPEGNIEYLLHLKKKEGPESVQPFEMSVEEVVKKAHETLDTKTE